MDYLGSLLAALLFPYLLLPVLGSLHTSLVTGLVNVALGVGVLIAFRGSLGRSCQRLGIQAGVIGLILGGTLVSATPLLERWESALYEDEIVHAEQSVYQKIVLTRRGEHTKLFLNEHLQFASVDEHRYHEVLVHPAMALARQPERVLIIGGGDGLTAREVLKYAAVREIHLVDLDRAVTDLARRNLYLTRLNKNALSQPEVRIFNEDGFIFLQEERVPYGVIFIDLPDPREEALAKLYSVEGYRMCRRLLAPGGVLVTQATSPYYARRAYWCIGATLEEAGFQVCSYHALVPSFGEWGFHLASLEPLELERIEFTVPRRFIESVLFGSLLHFDADMARIDVEPNRLDKPVLAHYYRQDWRRW